MHNNKLLKLLKSLDSDEFRRLNLLIKSPYYNYNKHVCNLYNYLKKYYPDFDSPKLHRHKVFEKLFPGETFDMNKLRKLMAALSHLVKEYMISIELEQEDFEKQKILNRIYGKRNLYHLFEQESRELTTKLKALPYRDDRYYQNMFELNQQIFFHPQTNKQKKNRKEVEENMIFLDAYYALTKLQLSAEMRSRERILDEQYDIHLLDEVKEACQSSWMPKNLLFEIYLNILELQKAPEKVELFKTLQAQLPSVIPQISREEQQNILTHLLNHSIRMLNRGHVSYRRDLFELYRLGLKFDLLIENDRMTELTYSNIASVGTRLGEFEWTRNFIGDYAAFLHIEVREDVRALSLGFWYFHQQAYKETIALLNRSQFSNVLNHLKARTLLIRTFFEQFKEDLSYYDFLLDQFNAFDKFIIRNKTIASHKATSYHHFIMYGKSLVRILYNQTDPTSFIESLEKEKQIVAKGWLRDKIKEYEHTQIKTL